MGWFSKGGSAAHAGAASGDHQSLKPGKPEGRIRVVPRTRAEIRADRSDRISWTADRNVPKGK